MFYYRRDEVLGNIGGDLAVFLGLLSDLLPFQRIVRLHAWWLLCENILDREDFIEQLELGLSHFLVLLVHKVPIKLIDMLEPVNYERFESLCVQYLIVVDEQLV